MLQRTGLFHTVVLVLMVLISSVSFADSLMISPVLLKQADMATHWQANLPLGSNEKVDRVFIFDKNIYVLTDCNYLFCLKLDTGKDCFAMQLTTPGLPVCTPHYYDEKLWFIVGNKLLVVNPKTGRTDGNSRM